jgi:hypothetical protein
MCFVSELSVRYCVIFNLFDDLEYKYIKHFIDDKNYKINLQIKELPCINGFRKLQFIMLLPPNNFKKTSVITYKEVCVIKHYEFGSYYHLKMFNVINGLYNDD